MQVSVIISYCSLDRRFIVPLLRQCSLFSNDIVISAFDTLLNGSPESYTELQAAKHMYPRTVKVLCLPLLPGNPPRHYHNLARWEGARFASERHLLFLDADEIPDGAILNEVLGRDLLGRFDAADFKCHWYFRSAKLQALQTEHCGLLLDREKMTEEAMFTSDERWSYRRIAGIDYRPLVSVGGAPFFHHFSWVRTQSEMAAKVDSWGHKFDRDWNALIDKEFAGPFSGKDFVHGYQYRNVSDRFNIGL